MKNLNVKHAAISSIVVYIFGILAFFGSFFIPIMNDLELQANLVLMVAIIPAAFLGTHIYYKRGHRTNGFVLGLTLFLGAMILDAIITVPLFIIPNGGSHLSFFGDPGFWLIGVEYVSVVAVYWQFNIVRVIQARRA